MLEPTGKQRGRRGIDNAIAAAPLQQIVTWYFDRVYGHWEGPGRLPFYCDEDQVGAFAVPREQLAGGSPRALFRMFVALAMYQGRRDVLVMEKQRSLEPRDVDLLTEPAVIEAAIAGSRCPHLATAERFAACDVARHGVGRFECGLQPGLPCHVKNASAVFGRMGDMGKLPTSAWLAWSDGVSRTLTSREFLSMSRPLRADMLVHRLSQIHRVGRKLATMFVSLVSVPELAPGATPWFPLVNGHELVVVDTNVAAGVASLAPHLAQSYSAQANWIREAAQLVDLRKFGLPKFSPRMVQQSLYWFGSASNRFAHGDPCSRRALPCDGCVPSACGFFRGQVGRRKAT